MIFKWGSHARDDNAVSVTISARSIYNEIGTRSGYTERWDCREIVQAASASAVTTAYAALRTALSVDRQDAILYDSDGTTIRHALYNAGSGKGTRVTDYAYPEGEGAEGSTFRTVTWSIEAEYETDLGMYSFSQSYDYTGGGPERVLIPVLIGPPVEQIVRQQTPYRCTQSGTAIGIGGYPTVPQPIFPAAEHIPQRQIRYESPRQLGLNGNRMYAVNWAYVFESASPMFALP